MKTTLKRANELQYAGQLRDVNGNLIQPASASQNREPTTEHDCPECGGHFSVCICDEAQGKPELPQHSPLPWSYSAVIGDDCIMAKGQDGRYIVAKMYVTQDVEQVEIEANKKLIVASVNHAGKLAEALRQIANNKLSDDNCASVELAGKRCANIAKQALADWTKADES